MNASQERVLNRLNDRCDRCGAEASAAAVMPSGSELLFCAHHAMASMTKLLEQNAELQGPVWHSHPSAWSR